MEQKELLKQAKAGNVESQATLGKLLYKKKKYKQAFLWLKKAAEKNHVESIYQVGRMYKDGIGTKRNCTEALKWLRLATEQGHPRAILSIGCMLLVKEVENEEAEKVFQWLLSIANKGNVEAWHYCSFRQQVPPSTSNPK